MIRGELIVIQYTTKQDKWWLLSEPLPQPVPVPSVRQHVLVAGQLQWFHFVYKQLHGNPKIPPGATRFGGIVTSEILE